jgi:hypothetical protein
MKRIINLNTPEIPCPFTHHFTTTKFCNGFKQNGLEFLELNTLNDIEKFNTNENIFVISNHFNGNGTKNFVYEIGKKLKNSIFICWHFNFEKEILNDMPFEKYMITGEYYRKKPQSSIEHINAYDFSNSCDKWVPFIFSSAIHPNEVGKLKKEIIYDACFIGSCYKPNIVNNINNCFKHYNYNGMISEEDRIEKYLNSLTCLGFHDDANILNSCVVERVFEGLSYGCIVLSDNKAAEDCTNGVVKYVNNIDDVNYYINKIKEDSMFREKTINDGYEYIKNEGTYYHLANKFLKKIETLYK